MAEYQLKLEKRAVSGKKVKNLRKEGKIPSVVFGGKTPELLQSDYVPTEKILLSAGYHSPIDLDIEGKKQLAIVKDVHIDPVSRQIFNVEFQAISAKEAVVATTPITIVNFEASEASKTYHFALNQSLNEIEIKAKPADLPKELTADAEKMASLDDRLTVADLKLPAGVEFVDKELDPETTVASLYDPAAEAEKREAAEAAEAAEATENSETTEEATESSESAEASESSETSSEAEKSE